MHRRYFKNFLLDRRFQLKYTLAIVLAGGVIFGTTEYFLYDKVRENTELTQLDEDSLFAAELRRELQEEDRKVLLTLAAAWLALVAVLFCIGVLATHKIVGPIFVVDRQIRRIARHEPVFFRPLRKGDEFQDLYRHLSEMAQSLRSEREEDVALAEEGLERLRAAIEAAGGEVQSADEAPLRSLIDAKRAYLDTQEPSTDKKNVPDPDAGGVDSPH